MPVFVYQSISFSPFAPSTRRFSRSAAGSFSSARQTSSALLGAAVHFRAVERDVQLLELLQRGVDLVGADVESEVQVSRARVRRIFRVLHEKIEAVVPDR